MAAPATPTTQTERWTGTANWSNPGVSLAADSCVTYSGSDHTLRLIKAPRGEPRVTDAFDVNARAGLRWTNVVYDIGYGQANDEGLWAVILPLWSDGTFTPTELLYVSQSGPSLDTSAYSTGLSDWLGCRALADSSGAGAWRFPSPYSSYHVYEYDTAGSVVYSTTLDAAYGAPLHFPRTERFLTYDGSTAVLRDSSAGTVASLAWTQPTGTTEWVSIGGGQVAAVYDQSGDDTVYVRVLDTSSDSLAWATSEMSITTDWPTGEAGQRASHSWDGQLTIHRQNFSGGGSSSVYWMNPLTGNVTSTATDSLGIGRLSPMGYYSSLFYDGTDGTTWNYWSSEASSVGPTLRQRQSPRRSPSRVGWY